MKLQRLTVRLMGAVIALILTADGIAHGENLCFSFADPVGDQTGTVDLTSLAVTFDNSTGNYSIALAADPLHPFYGSFRINVNLFNPDTGTTSDFPSFFQDNVKDFDLAVPRTTMTLTGNNSCLLAWDRGDRVSPSTSSGLGNPDGASGFSCNVMDRPFVAPWPQDNTNGLPYAIIVPEPATLSLLALGGLMALRRRR